MTTGSLGYKKGILTHDAWEQFVNEKVTIITALLGILVIKNFPPTYWARLALLSELWVMLL